LKHYRSFCFTSRENNLKVRRRFICASVGAALLLGGVLWPSTSKSQTSQGSASLSDETIIALVTERFRSEIIEAIGDEYGDLDHLSDDPWSQVVGMAPKTAGPLVSCTMNAPKEKDACVNRVRSSLMAERAARIKEVKNTDLADKFSFSVQQKTNYEGNYVALVDVRMLGTDKTSEWKLLLKRNGAAWSIADKKERDIQ